MATRIGIELSPDACRIVEIDPAPRWERRRGATRVRSFAVLPPSRPEIEAKLRSLRNCRAAVVVWNAAGDHRQVIVSPSSYESMRAEAIGALDGAGGREQGTAARCDAAAGHREQDAAGHVAAAIGVRASAASDCAPSDCAPGGCAARRVVATVSGRRIAGCADYARYAFRDRERASARSPEACADAGGCAAVRCSARRHSAFVRPQARDHRRPDRRSGRRGSRRPHRKHHGGDGRAEGRPGRSETAHFGRWSPLTVDRFTLLRSEPLRTIGRRSNAITYPH